MVGGARNIQDAMAGKFITFEGGEGAGKSTQIKRLADRLEAAGHAVVVTREPGGTPTAEEIRRMLLAGLAEQLGPDGEAVLFAAARADHVERVIRPALRTGKWVLSDRFSDSTKVYQGVGGGADDGVLEALDRVAVGRTQPHLTILLDLPVETGLARAARRMEQSGKVADRFERDDIALHEARRQAFLAIAKAEPNRVAVIDAAQSEEATADAVWKTVTSRLFERAA
jgi:dTMP kinase